MVTASVCVHEIECIELERDASKQRRIFSVTLLRQEALWLSASVARVATAQEAATNGVPGFRRRQGGYGGQVAGFRKDAPRLAAGCFTITLYFRGIFVLTSPSAFCRITCHEKQT